MSEPTQDWVRQRVEETKRIAKLPRMVDMPAVAPDLRIGTLHVRPRLPVIRRLPSHHCAICGNGFWPRGTTQLYCGHDCRHQAKLIARRKGGARLPVNVRPERAAVVTAICAVWTGITAGEIASDSRTACIAHPRMAAYALVRLFRPDASLPDIGRAFGRDHTSIISGLRAHEKRMANAEYALRYREAEARARAALGLS